MGAFMHFSMQETLHQVVAEDSRHGHNALVETLCPGGIQGPRGSIDEHTLDIRFLLFCFTVLRKLEDSARHVEGDAALVVHVLEAARAVEGVGRCDGQAQAAQVVLAVAAVAEDDLLPRLRRQRGQSAKQAEVFLQDARAHAACLVLVAQPLLVVVMGLLLFHEVKHLLLLSRVGYLGLPPSLRAGGGGGGRLLLGSAARSLRFLLPLLFFFSLLWPPLRVFDLSGYSSGVAGLIVFFAVQLRLGRGRGRGCGALLRRRLSFGRRTSAARLLPRRLLLRRNHVIDMPVRRSNGSRLAAVALPFTTPRTIQTPFLTSPRNITILSYAT
eukprot:scaffold247_cov172-Ochromonas_danica.AAC.16